MSLLSNQIYDYYCTHFDTIPADKQFHFASRLYFWSRDPFSKEAIARLQLWFTRSDVLHALKTVQQDTLQNPPSGSQNAQALRQQYAKRYPKLRLYTNLLFRTLFLQTVYNLEARDALFTLIQRHELELFRAQLLADEDAIRMLSTHAVNFFYLYSFAIGDAVNAEPLLTIGRTGYDMNDPIHLQLWIYLYTHCIIGQSLFYYRAITDNLQTLHAMLDALTRVIEEQFININLDNKFEYLVCSKLLGIESKLRARIFDEAEQSLSPDGVFVIDQHNNNPQHANQAFAASEHRNVLYLMANRDFTPLVS